VMSQQSTMPTVVRYFQKWMTLFPTVFDLAKAKEPNVLKAWEGLGYYSRARNVLASAKLLDAKLRASKTWPNSVEEWMSLPGVGDYTAKAITAICFEGKQLPVDGNVIRVVARLLAIDDPLNSSKDKAQLIEAVKQLEALASSLPMGDLAQAFMELGSEICRPGALADCANCCLSRVCLARARDVQALIPQKKKQREKVQLESLALAYRKGDQILLRQIPKGRRLEGQWELPVLNLEKAGSSIKSLISDHFELRAELTHFITHHQYRAFWLEAGLWRGVLPAGHKWLNLEKWRHFDGSLSTLTRKLLILVEKQS